MQHEDSTVEAATPNTDVLITQRTDTQCAGHSVKICMQFVAATQRRPASENMSGDLFVVSLTNEA